jgi:pyrrolidone-carboxylate peptidase
LERQAKNWKDFAIPDNAMNFPQRMKIFEGGPNLLKTNVDIELLREESDHLFDMRISSDAG